MDELDFNTATMAALRDLIMLRDTNMSPGQLLAFVRRAYNIPADGFAARLNTTVQHLDDIESGRAPFPTILLMLIFIYGVPDWYMGVD